MSSETNYGGVNFEDMRFKALMGSSVLGMMEIKEPVMYGLNRRVQSRLLAGQEKIFNTLRDSYLKTGSFSPGQNARSVFTQSTDSFSRHLKSRMSVSPESSKLFNRLVSGQAKFYSGRKAEAIRRLSMRTVEVAGKKRAVGYFNKSVWKLASAKGRGMVPYLAKAAIGKGAAITSKVLMAGWQIGLLYEVGSSTVKYLRESARKSSSLDFGKPFETTEGLYTERQRALSAITSSRMSTRSAVGGEAQLMHR